MIRKKTDSGWWEGELQTKGRRRQHGWFPATYVKILAGGRMSGRTTPLSSSKINLHETVIGKSLISPQRKISKVDIQLQIKFRPCIRIRLLTMMSLASSPTISLAFSLATSQTGGEASSTVSLDFSRVITFEPSFLQVKEINEMSLLVSRNIRILCLVLL